MFRKENGKDITDDEYNKICLPFLEKKEEFLETNIMPEYIAYCIFTGYTCSSMWEASFDSIINSEADIFNRGSFCVMRMKKNIKKILRDKYSMEVIEEEPILKVKTL